LHKFIRKRTIIIA